MDTKKFIRAPPKTSAPLTKRAAPITKPKPQPSTLASAPLSKRVTNSIQSNSRRTSERLSKSSTLPRSKVSLAKSPTGAVKKKVTAPIAPATQSSAPKPESISSFKSDMFNYSQPETEVNSNNENEPNQSLKKLHKLIHSPSSNSANKRRRVLGDSTLLPALSLDSALPLVNASSIQSSLSTSNENLLSKVAFPNISQASFLMSSQPDFSGILEQSGLDTSVLTKSLMRSSRLPEESAIGLQHSHKDEKPSNSSNIADIDSLLESMIKHNSPVSALLRRPHDCSGFSNSDTLPFIPDISKWSSGALIRELHELENESTGSKSHAISQKPPGESRQLQSRPNIKSPNTSTGTHSSLDVTPTKKPSAPSNQPNALTRKLDLDSDSDSGSLKSEKTDFLLFPSFAPGLQPPQNMSPNKSALLEESPKNVTKLSIRSFVETPLNTRGPSRHLPRVVSASESPAIPPFSERIIDGSFKKKDHSVCVSSVPFPSPSNRSSSNSDFFSPSKQFSSFASDLGGISSRPHASIVRSTIPTQFGSEPTRQLKPLVATHVTPESVTDQANFSAEVLGDDTRNCDNGNSLAAYLLPASEFIPEKTPQFDRVKNILGTSDTPSSVSTRNSQYQQIELYHSPRRSSPSNFTCERRGLHVVFEAEGGVDSRNGLKLIPSQNLDLKLTPLDEAPPDITPVRKPTLSFLSRK